MYAKDLSELKFEFLIKKSKDAGTKHLNDSNVFIECLNMMNDVYENIDKWLEPKEKKKIFDYVWWHDCRHYE